VWALVVFVRSYERKLARLSKQVKNQARTYNEIKCQLEETKAISEDVHQFNADLIDQISKIESLCSRNTQAPGFWPEFNAITGTNAGGGA
jgi:septal ring factor EnvC (AmiA/AmiB activator)